ncbi:MAG: hypothetical protein DSY37_00630 [Hyperthermus sp.]|nr:MAG: hypothetical protein DSY37_00630 [Hyperthermus sp.]
MTTPLVQRDSILYLHLNQDAYHVNITRLKCLLKCVLSLNEEEAQVLSFLIVQGRGLIAKDIASSLNRNPEVVRRALRSLYSRKLVSRKPYPLRRGGRAYMYEVPRPLIRMLMSICMKMDELMKTVSRLPHEL